MLGYKEDLQFMEEDFGDKGRVRASSLMYAFQEAAAAHAEQLGLGFAPMMAQNYIWVMTKLRFRVYTAMSAGRAYRLETYPRPKKGVTFFRDYYIYDGEDRLMAAGTSQWCIINFATRRIERVRVNFDGEFIDHEAFEDGIEKIKVSKEGLRQVGSHLVAEADLDVNQHVNNCRYADMMEAVLTEGEGEGDEADAAGGDEGYSDVTIHFAKEARLGDEILLYREASEEGVVVVGKLTDDTVVFEAKAG